MWQTWRSSIVRWCRLSFTVTEMIFVNDLNHGIRQGSQRYEQANSFVNDALIMSLGWFPMTGETMREVHFCETYLTYRLWTPKMSSEFIVKISESLVDRYSDPSYVWPSIYLAVVDSFQALISWSPKFLLTPVWTIDFCFPLNLMTRSSPDRLPSIPFVTLRKPYCDRVCDFILTVSCSTPTTFICTIRKHTMNYSGTDEYSYNSTKNRKQSEIPLTYLFNLHDWDEGRLGIIPSIIIITITSITSASFRRALKRSALGIV